MIVGHLLQMNGSARGYDLIESGSAIGQFALSPDLDELPSFSHFILPS